MDVEQLQGRFFEQLRDQPPLAELYDLLSDVYLFVKDRDGRFLLLNRALVRALGLTHKEEVLGKTDFDLFSPDLAQRYRDEDEQVMQSATPVVDQVWLVPNLQGGLGWFVSSKMPLFSRAGEVMGIAGLMRDFRRAGALLGPYIELTPAIEYIMAHYAEPITIAEIAAQVELSVSQFERRFKQRMRQTPLQYLTEVRLNAACQQLRAGEASITQIAHDNGFYDHSYFVKRFKQYTGQAPSAYRRRELER